MVRIIFFITFFGIFNSANAQVFELGRTTAWENAGLTQPLTAYSNQVSVIDFGADPLGLNSTNQAYNQAITSLDGHAGTIFFPVGEYFFDAALALPDSVFLKGESIETLLKFDLGGSGHLILISGSSSSTEFELATNATKGTNTLTLADASTFSVGNHIQLGMFDEDLMFSSWAYGTMGQVVEIIEIDGNTLTLADPLNHHYPLWRTPFVKLKTPRTGAGIECLSIERLDASTGQTSNIMIQNAFNCVVRNIQSENTNFAHLDIRSSSHIQVEGCYFHHAFAYGGGGQGYGVATQSTTSFCLIQNNVFEHLRHSMIIQSAANGNVFGYNYSSDPYWTEGGFFPANSAGDAVLHGNYTYLNLFEGNTIQNIVVDASHESNGPFNTFFRNRAELFGFFSDPNTPTDSMNIVGNEITATGGFPYGMLSISGIGHYSYGNNQNGTCVPASTEQIGTNSLYLNSPSEYGFLGNNVLPMAGYPNQLNEKLLPAEERFDLNLPVSCTAEVVTSITESEEEIKLAELVDNVLQLAPSLLPATVAVYSADGRLISLDKINAQKSEMKLPADNGIYLIAVDGQSQSTTIKVTRIN